jgi:hypothetical protein
MWSGSGSGLFTLTPSPNAKHVPSLSYRGALSQMLEAIVSSGVPEASLDHFAAIATSKSSFSGPSSLQSQWVAQPMSPAGCGEYLAVTPVCCQLTLPRVSVVPGSAVHWAAE